MFRLKHEILSSLAQCWSWQLGVRWN